MSIITGIDGTVLILGTGIAIAICIVAGLAIKKIRATARGNSAEISADRIRIPLIVQKSPVGTTEEFTHGTVFISALHPKDIDCIHGKADISESLELSRKNIPWRRLHSLPPTACCWPLPWGHRQLMSSAGTVKFILTIPDPASRNHAVWRGA